MINYLFLLVSLIATMHIHPAAKPGSIKRARIKSESILGELHTAVLQNDVKKADDLVKAGLDPSQHSAMQIILQEKKNEMLDWLMSLPGSDFTKITIVLKRMIKPYDFLTSPLSFAAFVNYPYAIKKFLGLGVSVNLPDPDKSGRTPLFWALASYKDATESIELLVAKGADLYNEDDQHLNAAMFGIQQQGNKENIKAIINNGFDSDRPNSQGISLKQFAQQNERQDLLDLFSEFSKAKKAGHKHVVSVLQQQEIHRGPASIAAAYTYGELTPQEKAEMVQEQECAKKE